MIIYEYTYTQTFTHQIEIRWLHAYDSLDMSLKNYVLVTFSFVHNQSVSCIDFCKDDATYFLVI